MVSKPLGIVVAGSLVAALPAQASWVQRASAFSPPARSGTAIAPGPANTIVLFGGVGTQAFYAGDTWILDGAGWRPATTAVAPPARGGHGMVFDMLRGRVVLFGGWSSSGWRDDTWEWDGAAWLQRAPSTRPTPRGEFGMSYDLIRGTTVLFGGTDLTGIASLGDTWEWDGIAWTRKVTPTAPAPRCGSAMAFDFASLRTLLFGGFSPVSSPGFFGDTWEYDGASWRQLSPAHSPRPRQRAAMAADMQRNRVVLFGGVSAFGLILGDTWEWDGAVWLQRAPAASPSARYAPAGALDMARSRIVLFGGGNAGASTSNETWEYYTTAMPSVALVAPGCAGSAGPAALAVSQRPWLGDALQVFAYPTPRGAPALLALGLSSTTWGTLSLPASLAAVGMPGCALAVSVDATIAMTVPTSGTAPACTLTLPANTAFAGMSLFAQALVIDPAANPAGFVLSSALALQLGAR